jgi:hypothetical protein
LSRPLYSRLLGALTQVSISRGLVVLGPRSVPKKPRGLVKGTSQGLVGTQSWHPVTAPSRGIQSAPSHGPRFPTEVRSRRPRTGNWQHWHWQHFHIGNIPPRLAPPQNELRPVAPPPENRPYSHIFALPSCATAIDLVFYPSAMALCQSHRQAGRPPLMARSDPRHYFYSGE